MTSNSGSREIAELLEKGKNYNEWFDVVPGVRIQFIEAGHILGAAMLVIEVTENGSVRHIGFSADLGRSSLPIIRDPAPMPSVELLICESTYGNRKHARVDAEAELAPVIRRVAARGGVIVIAAFAVGRAQGVGPKLAQRIVEDRPMTTTSQPFARNVRRSADPTNPLPPITHNVCINGVSFRAT